MKPLCLVVLLSLFLSCANDDVQQNPYLNQLPPFEFELNLNLPQYDNLRFTGGTLTLPQLGLRGVHFYNLNGTQLLAWEASCPNHRPNTCSSTEIQGIETKCNCEDYLYSLVTGQPLSEDAQYGMANYGVRRTGNLVLIYN